MCKDTMKQNNIKVKSVKNAFLKSSNFGKRGSS